MEPRTRILIVDDQPDNPMVLEDLLSARPVGQRALGYLERGGQAARSTFKPVPAAWFSTGHVDFCRRLAAREGLAMPAGLDLAPYEARGWQRRHEVARLGLGRLAFRRALELWLALDRASFLERAGYAVMQGEFCPRAVTPRNLLTSARL